MEFQTPDRDKPIAIFVHVFYPEVWESILRRIEECVDIPFHLVLTAPPDAARTLRRPSHEFLISYRVLEYDNRGRDTLPFWNALSEPIDFDIGLKLHTKRSTHRLEGDDWGLALLRALLPSPDMVSGFRDAMLGEPRLCMLVPDGMLVSQTTWMSGNRSAMDRLAGRFGLDLEQLLERTPVFCAGSMFWFRRSDLADLVAVRIDDLFEAEAGQVDGTAAHALERLLAPLAERGGGVAIPISGLKPDADHEELHRASRVLVDQPNPFLKPPSGFVRLLLAVPGVRNGYVHLPKTWRSRIRSLLSR